MKLQLNFQIVRFLNYKQRFSDSLPHTRPPHLYAITETAALGNLRD